MENPILPDNPSGSPTGAAPTQNGVENQPAQKSEYEAELLAKDEKIARLEQERTNYRTGMLKYKKLAEDHPEDKSFDEEKVKQMIREEMLNTEIAQENRAKDEIIKRVLKENNEMKVAIQNKAQIANIPGGASQPQDNSQPNKLTDEQKAFFAEQAKMLGVKAEDLEKKFLENWEKTKNK